MKYLIQIIFILTIHLLHGQDTFFKKIDPSHDETEWDYGSNIIALNNGYIFTTNTICNEDINKCQLLIGTDESGNIEKIGKSEQLEAHNISKSAVLAVNGDIVIVSRRLDSVLDNQVRFTIYDTSFNVLNREEYGSEASDLPFEVLVESDTTYLVIGSTKGDGDSGASIFLMRLDLNGNLIKEKVIDDTLAHSGEPNISLSNDGGVIIGHVGRLEKFRVLNHIYVLTKLDHNWDIEWHKLLKGNNTKFASPRISRTVDDNYIVSWVVDSIIEVNGEIVQHHPYVSKISNEGATIWEYHFYNSSYTIVEIEELSDGTILGCGYKTDGSTFGWSFKLTQEGELLWDILYTDTNPENNVIQLFDFKELDDKRIAFTGQAYLNIPGIGHYNGAIALLVVDSNGCIQNRDCHDGKVVVKTKSLSKEESIRVFPNPADMSIQIAGLSSLSHIEASLFSVDGHLQQSWYDVNLNPMLNLSPHLSRGVYILRISSGDMTVLYSKKIVLK